MRILVKRQHISELINAGDWVRVSNGIVLACPFCGQRMSCENRVVCEEPLTLEPSIVGPGSGVFIEHCGHHFFIREGAVVST